MVITNKIVLRQLSKRQWIRPEVGLQRLQTSSFFSKILPEVGGSRTWRKGRFKKYWEEFQAALFTYGLSQQSPDYDWEYSYGELPSFPDGDCFVRCEIADGAIKPVQLKELVPAELNAQSSIQQLIDNLTLKYTATPGQEMLVVAIYVNRETTINFQQLRMPKLNIEQLWLYGFLYGTTVF